MRCIQRYLNNKSKKNWEFCKVVKDTNFANVVWTANGIRQLINFECNKMSKNKISIWLCTRKLGSGNVDYSYVKCTFF